MSRVEKEIDCIGTDNIVCPYCGYEWEWDHADKPDGVQQCGDCDKFFDVEADWSVTFSSAKLDCHNGSPHEWKKNGYWHHEGEELWACKMCRKSEIRKGDALRGAGGKHE